MKVFSREIEYKYGDEFKLICFSDVHYGAAACDENEFVKMLKAHGNKQNTFFIGIGDQLNCIWVKDPRFRVSENAPKYHDKEDFIDWQINDFASLIRYNTQPEQWLGMGSGNHELAMLKYTSSDPHRRLCEIVGTTDLGYSFFYNLNFTNNGGGGRTVVIYGHHGWGGGARTEGANLTKFAKNEAHYDADISLYGHTHDKFGKRMIRILPTRKGQLRVIQKPMVIANCGTFLKTLSTDERPTYSEQCGYPPRDIGYIIVKLNPDTKKEFVDMRVTE